MAEATVLILVVLAAVLTVLAWPRAKDMREAPVDVPFSKKGVRGWLVVPVAAFVLVAWRKFNDLFDYARAASMWSELFSDDRFAILRWITVLAAFLTAAVFVSAIASFVSAVTWKPFTVAIVYSHYALVVASAFLDAVADVLAYQIEQVPLDGAMPYRAPVAAIIGATVWITYFRRSRRVKNTFAKPQQVQVAA